MRNEKKIRSVLLEYLLVAAKGIANGLLVAVAVLVAHGTTVEAADVSYIGFQENVEANGDTPTTGWRNSTPAKPLDIDGDSILGTDGYSIPKWGLQSLPSYIGSVTKLSAGENGSTGWGKMDNPADPSGSDTVGWAMWFNSEDLVQFTISGSDLDGKTLRVGVIFGIYHSAFSETLRWTQTVGGSVVETSPSLAYDCPSGFEIAFFDFANVADGDTFNLSVPATAGGYQHAGGLTFDTLGEPAPAGTVIFVR